MIITVTATLTFDYDTETDWVRDEHEAKEVVIDYLMNEPGIDEYDISTEVTEQ